MNARRAPCAAVSSVPKSEPLRQYSTATGRLSGEKETDPLPVPTPGMWTVPRTVHMAAPPVSSRYARASAPRSR
jgi:hypothetical protein